MRGKVLFVAGAAVGYVLGARAGRKRYEQIKSAAARVWETPAIQRQVNAVEDYAAQKFGEIPGAVFDGAKKVVVQAVSRAKGRSGVQSRAGGASTTVVAPAVPSPAEAPEAAEKPEAVEEPEAKSASKPAKAAAKPAAKPAARKPSTTTPKRAATKPPTASDEADDAGA